MKRMASVFGILATLVAAFDTTANAQSVTYFEHSNWDMGSNSQLTGSIMFPQFNPALGVLNSVDIDFYSAYGGTVMVSGPNGAAGDSSISELGTMHDSGNNISLSIGNNWECYIDMPYYTPSGSSEPGETLASYNSPAVLSEFTGNGNFSLEVDGSQSASPVFGSSGVDVNITDGDFSTSVYLTYDYTVPEPGSVSLMVIGFGLMLASRKAKRSRQNRTRA